jgi:K+-transporting ATPase, c chain
VSPLVTFEGGPFGTQNVNGNISGMGYCGRGTTEDAVRRLVSEHTYGRQLGFLGEPRVNIVELNLDLDAQRNRRGRLETPGAPSNPSVGFGGNLGHSTSSRSEDSPSPHPAPPLSSVHRHSPIHPYQGRRGILSRAWAKLWPIIATSLLEPLLSSAMLPAHHNGLDQPPQLKTCTPTGQLLEKLRR